MVKKRKNSEASGISPIPRNNFKRVVMPYNNPSHRCSNHNSKLQHVNFFSCLTTIVAATLATVYNINSHIVFYCQLSFQGNLTSEGSIVYLTLLPDTFFHGKECRQL